MKSSMSARAWKFASLAGAVTVLTLSVNAGTSGTKAAPKEVRAMQPRATVTQLYQQNCLNCHGPSGEGGGAGTKTFLTREKYAQDLDKPYFDAIKKGVPDMAMPSYGEAMSDEQIWGLVVLIREMQGRALRREFGSPRAVNGVYRSQRHNFKVETVVDTGKGLKTPWGIDWLPTGEMLVTNRPGGVGGRGHPAGGPSGRGGDPARRHALPGRERGRRRGAALGRRGGGLPGADPTRGTQRRLTPPAIGAAHPACGWSRDWDPRATRLTAARNAFADASSESVETPRPRKVWLPVAAPAGCSSTVTSAWASFPTVTAWTRKSRQTVVMPVSFSIARKIPSIGPSPAVTSTDVSTPAWFTRSTTRGDWPDSHESS